MGNAMAHTLVLDPTPPLATLLLSLQEEYLDTKLSQKILKEAQAQRAEEEAEQRTVQWRPTPSQAQTAAQG